MREGLRPAPKELTPKYFYDERGSELFDDITRLPEYYPTRTERAILTRVAPGLAPRPRPAELVELGSAPAPQDPRPFLERCYARALSSATCRSTSAPDHRSPAAEASAILPGSCSVHGVVGDFDRDLDACPARTGTRLVAFLGGTIGNLEP